MKPLIHVIDLGTMPYLDAWRDQQTLQLSLITRKRNVQAAHADTGAQGSTTVEPGSGLPPDPSSLPDGYLLFVEHPHVYTIGKSGDWNNLLFPDDILAQKGIDVVKTDRGGDITYHGPGQIVGYPVLDLERFGLGIARYIETLEEVIIRTAAHFGITAQRIDGRTGVWVKNNKLCALGIKCSRYVSMHGFALNAFTDLDYYSGIIPCGINDGGVTSFERLLDSPPSGDKIRDQLVLEFQEQFGCRAELMP